MRARYVIVSTGTLSQAKLPGIPGIESFRGHTFHTSRWDYGYTGGSAEGGLRALADKTASTRPRDWRSSVTSCSSSRPAAGDCSPSRR
ncbi:hypothetical protein [Streptomyces sp. NPDC052610]|uniref:hypothetical protein n=1 Tax=Streptomyces sp. NPDC052610 TaxID=3154952 RepID=UPI003419A29B